MKKSGFQFPVIHIPNSRNEMINKRNACQYDICLTGNISGIVEFHNQCSSAGIKKSKVRARMIQGIK